MGKPVTVSRCICLPGRKGQACECAAIRDKYFGNMPVAPAPVPLDYADIAQMQAWARGIMRRDPDFIIGGPGNPYMRRWFVIPRNPWGNVYLHEILRSDDDRALHDHPWPNRTVVIDGSYIEMTPQGQHLRLPGDVVEREAEAAHRLVIGAGEPAISLFFTGPKVREWGFHCPQGWRHWQEFTGGAHGETIGRGCD